MSSSVTAPPPLRVLFIVPITLDVVWQKFGSWQPILERNEGGLVERVVTVHLQGERTRVETLSEAAVVHEFGLDCFPWPGSWRWLSRICAPLYLLRLVWALCGLVRRERISLIRVNGLGIGAAVGWLTARLTRVPWCISIHAPLDQRTALRTDEEHLLGSTALERKLRYMFLPLADMVLPIRESMVDDLVRLGVARQRIHVIPHGVDMAPLCAQSGLDIRARYGLPPQAPIISFAGRLTEENYIWDMLDIARSTATVRDDVRFVLAGGGLREDEVRRRVADDPLLRRVVLVPGYEPREVVYALRQASAVNLCLMAGFSLIEACASARPCIAYDVEWHSELVRSNETGVLVPEHRTDLVVEHLLRLLDDPEEARRLGEAARELACQRHNAALASQIKVDLYRRLVQGRASVTGERDPRKEAAARNPWYLDDQWKSTWERPSYKALILQRWSSWRQSIQRWLPAYEAARETGDTPPAPLRVLDAGCGDGVNLHGLKQIFADLSACPCQFSGMDYNVIRLERASARYADVELLEGDLTALELPEASYDCILCNHVLEHIRDDGAALRHLRRVLRPGGLLLLGVPNEGCFLAQLRNRCLQRSILRTTDHVNFYTLATLRQRVQAAGWRELRSDRAGFFLPRQELHSLVANTGWGRTVLDALGRYFPSQGTDLQMALTPAGERSIQPGAEQR